MIAIQNYDETELNDKVQLLQDAEFEITNLREERKKQKRIIDDKQTKIEHLETHQI